MGAGTMHKGRSTPELCARYKAALSRAPVIGYQVLSTGGEAMDAVVAAVSSMEDCVLFNAGKGGSLARALYLSPETAPHTMLSGANAEKLREAFGVQLVDESYFWTEARWREHRRGLVPTDLLDQIPTGAVGAVALDERGCIAACTSTGGRTNKLVGRVGDTPHMGAGFWAEEWKMKGWARRTWRNIKGKGAKAAVGVSGTGDGDYFIRLATASTIGRRVKYLNEPLAKAARHCIEELRRDGGIGGVIALNNQGNVAMPLNCSGMYRGIIREDGRLPKPPSSMTTSLTREVVAWTVAVMEWAPMAV
ncbi:N-terminal nucleophile aminohydrolase [Wolfiporia cocos MD-104 SS10]|uniref:N-terminal nucleophile aminohydrolase n=1 Tax=Wolfiporia cocos (strain MD-104) TaxID=742152 RepID=A0A2H3JMU7_WOLCO|nr:N-terminal nucleophile aminohydrolase [Wolfiporia cocos MD-104 SS10]